MAVAVAVLGGGVVGVCVGEGVGTGGFGGEGFDGLGVLAVRGFRATGARAAERLVLRDWLEDRRDTAVGRVRRAAGFDVRRGLAGGATGRTNGSTEMI